MADFGQEVPPLVDFLKAVLERYPDGGQILKELVQNGDDSGATEMKFIYDGSTYGTSSLYSPEMARFQGPALVVVNDGVFTKDDWNNITKLGRSYKKADPLKVGRFGLGFNSVYHITDMPMILSGSNLVIFEPTETILGRTPGKLWNLTDHRNELQKLSDQVAPFKPFVGQHAFHSGYFNGTVFRFPLRDTASSLSGNLYTKEKVEDLFENFQSEADNILLFLNHVSLISLAEKMFSDQQPVLKFRVESNVTSGEMSRIAFLSALKTHSEVIQSGEKSQLKLKNEAKQAVWSLKITSTSKKGLILTAQTFKLPNIQNFKHKGFLAQT